MAEEDPEVETTKLEMPDPGADYIVLVIIVIMLISVPVRAILQKLNISYLQNACFMIIAMLYAFILTSSTLFLKAIEVMEIHPAMFFHSFLPIFITSTIYRVPHYVFLRCLPQVCVTVVFRMIVETCIRAATFTFLFNTRWTFTQGVLSALVTLPIQPLNILLLLDQITMYRFLGPMLAAEAVVILIPVLAIFEILIGIEDGYVVEFRQVIFILLRQLCGGLLVGAIVGSVVASVLKLLYKEPINVIVMTLGMNYFVYFLCEKLLCCSGSLACLLLNCCILWERHNFTDEVKNNLTHFWNFLHYGAEIVLLMVCTTTFTIHVIQYFHPQDIYTTVLLFLAAGILRLLTWLAISPLLNRMKFHLNFKCLVVLGWNDIKGGLNLNMALQLLKKTTHANASNICIHKILFYVWLTNVLSVACLPVILRVFKLVELSNLRKHNINNCMSYIMEKRSTLITILKMDRFLGLANWSLVKQVTHLSTPFPNLEETRYAGIKKQMIADKNCAACDLDFLDDTNEKKLNNILQETELSIVKAKKISIMKQFENGILGRYPLEELVHYLEILYESHKADKGIRTRFLQKNWFLVFLRKLLVKSYAHKPYTPPTTYFGSLCFYIVMHMAYDSTLAALTLCYAIVSIIINSEASRYAMYVTHVVLTVLFLCDFILHLFGYSATWLVITGIRPFFRRRRNIIDFLLLVLMVTNLRLNIYYHTFFWWHFYVMPGPRLVAVLRIIAIPNMLTFLCPFLIKCIDEKIDDTLCFEYDLATGLLNSSEEILEMLPELVELKMIREIYYKNIRRERDDLVKKLKGLHKERPWIAITMKTKQAIRTSLTVMEATLNEFKLSGFLDNIEYSFIFDEILKKQKFLRSISFIQGSLPKNIFKEILWMPEENNVLDYLFENAVMLQFSEEKVVIQHSRITSGIYILVTGLLRLSYNPRNFTGENLGCIPIVDYINQLKQDTEMEDDIVPGNSIGELSFLTRRSYDCLVYAVLPSQAYYISNDIIREAMKLDCNPVIGLKARMWKSAVTYLAIAVLMEIPVYKLYTPQQIKLKLERSFVPNLKGYNVFHVTEMMDDIILIEGIVEDPETGTIYVAPVLLARTCQKFTFPKRTEVLAGGKVRHSVVPRLLIIPIGDASELEIMEQAEEIGDLKENAPSRVFLKKRRTTKSNILISMSQSMQSMPRIFAHTLETTAGVSRHNYLKIITLDEDHDDIRETLEDISDKQSYLQVKVGIDESTSPEELQSYNSSDKSVEVTNVTSDDNSMSNSNVKQ